MIYTISHSNITQESFIELLKLFKLQLVVDVRSSPYSNMFLILIVKILINHLKIIISDTCS